MYNNTTTSPRPGAANTNAGDGAGAASPPDAAEAADRRNGAQSPTPGAGGAQPSGTPAAAGAAETSPQAATSPATTAPANETSVDAVAAKKEEHKQIGNFSVGKYPIDNLERVLEIFKRGQPDFENGHFMA